MYAWRNREKTMENIRQSPFSRFDQIPPEYKTGHSQLQPICSTSNQWKTYGAQRWVGCVDPKNDLDMMAER